MNKIEINFQPTLKQHQAFELLDDHTNGVSEVLYGGSAGCFVGGTLVLTKDGYKPIENISVGDLVFSFNEEKLIFELKKVLKTFKNNTERKNKNILKFEINGKSFECTDNHRFWFRGDWNSAGAIATGKVEIHNRNQQKIFDKQYGTVVNNKLEKQWEAINYETSIGCTQLSKNNDNVRRWKIQNNKIAQDCSSGMDSKCKSISTNQPYQLLQTRQQSGEFGMVHSSNELSTLEREDDFKMAKRKTTTSKLQTLRFKNRYIYFKGRTGIGDKSKVQAKNIYKRNVGKRVWGFTTYNKRYNSTKELESYLIGHRISNEIVYDLEVEDNHNYVVTENNIIAHNSGKTFLLCAWLIINCLRYPKSRWLLGRAKLTTLKQTTLKTFYDVARSWNLDSEKDFKYNQQNNVITFYNGSEIILKDLFSYPSDPDFDSLGSLEITGAAIDEVSQVSHKAVQIVSSRIRYKLDEFNITPKLFMSCNPSKGWLYSLFYKPTMDGNILPYRRFIQALSSDNQHISQHYINQLLKLDERSKKRLLEGSWEFDVESDDLFSAFEILECFNQPTQPAKEKYITCDPARFGNDKTVVTLWFDKHLKNVYEFQGQSLDSSVNFIKQLMSSNGVYARNVIIDSDGVGGGVADFIKGSVAFVNNSKALNDDNYQNLKTQCYYKLSEFINKREISFDSSLKLNGIADKISQELTTIKMKDIEVDGKKKISSKDEQKQLLGHSPDFADAIMLRMHPLLRNTSKTYSFIRF